MTKDVKTVEVINERIRNGEAVVVSASEMKSIVEELGPEKAVHEVDVVTTGTFGAMCSSGLWMNFGHTEPPMKMTRVWLNDVEAYAGVAAVDAFIGATQLSEKAGMDYGGGHVIEDLLKGKEVHLRAEAYGTDCYPRKELSAGITIDDLNQAVLSNPRNGYERYAVAVNGSDQTIYTYMGKLLPHFGNATFSGAGAIAPILNDPTYQTIGVGTRIFLGGGQGYVIGHGTQHSPGTGFGTLMVQGDLKEMDPKYIRGATMTRYGTTLFVGLGIPIPILNADIARATGITDDRIVTKVFDYSQPTRSRTPIREVTYEELRSGVIEVGGKDVDVAPLSSFKVAQQIADDLKRRIIANEFYLTAPVELLSTKTQFRPFNERPYQEIGVVARKPPVVTEGQAVYRDVERCIHCGVCVTVCPAGVFQRGEDGSVVDDPSQCTECQTCIDVCPHKAIGLGN